MLDTVKPGADEPNGDVARSQTLRGEALCATGHVKAGFELLQAALAEAESSSEYAYDPELASWRAITGTCALTNGQRKRATELAELARASFVARPNVSPYYKRALEQLDRRLGTRSAGPLTRSGMSNRR